MIVTLPDHRAFQRAALSLVGAGGGASLVVPLVDLAPGRWWVLAAMALVALAGAPRAGGLCRRLASAALVLAGVGVGALAALAVTPGWLLGPASAADVLTAAGVGLVAALGVLPLHLDVRRDPVGRALASSGQSLGVEERALCARAAAAERHIHGALAADRVTDARALRRLARALAVGTVALARQAHHMSETAAAVDATAIAARLEELAAQRARASTAAAQPYDTALAALREQQAHLGAIRGAADRLRAHVHGQVALLEGTALALAARRGALAADDAAALRPLVERLREVSAHARAEATALESLA